jgi:hypothetical protein
VSIYAKEIAKAQALGRAAKMMVLGHSYVVGFGAGTGTNGYINSDSLGFAGRMPAKLAARGINVERHAVFGGSNVFFVGNVQPPYADARLTFGTGWTEDSNGSFTLGAHAWVGAVGSGFADFTPGFTFTSARVWHLKTTGANTSVGAYIDGVLASTISQVGTPASISPTSRAPATRFRSRTITVAYRLICHMLSSVSVQGRRRHGPLRATYPGRSPTF